MIKYLYTLDYPQGERSEYLAWVRSIAPTLQAPEEVRRVAAYENYHGASPHRFVELGSLPSDVLVIRDVRIDGVRVNAQQKLLKKSNLLLLLDNLRAYAETSEDTLAWTTRFVIEHVATTDVSVTLRVPFLADRSVAVPDVRVNDIGLPSVGVSIPEVPLRLLEPVLSEVLRALQRRALEQ